ncbi:MAG: B12-binding domain-containing radical SAM protein [Nitrospinota bacterium]
MHVLLINPPQTFPKKFYSVKDMRISIPLGLLSVAASAEAAGFKVSILDAFTVNNHFELHENKNTIRLGCSFETLGEEIQNRAPDVVGITSPFSAQVENALKVAQIAKEIDKKILVVGGGPHASVRVEDYFKNSCFDVAVMAEGELAFVDLLKHFETANGDFGFLNKIPNLAFQEAGRVKKNRVDFIPKLDPLPFPAYHMVNLEKYFELFKEGFSSRTYPSSERVVPVITSRGCPYKCVFCSIHSHMGRKWRFHSAEYVLRHLKLLVEKYNVKHFSFEDDNISVDIHRFEKIVDGILSHRKRSVRWKISWDTPNGVRADTLTEEVLKKSKQSGLHFLVIAIESGDQEVLDTIINKKMDLKCTEDVAKWCKKLGINLGAFFIIGFPGETKENIQTTLDMAFFLNKKYDVIPSIALATPLLDTKLYDIAKKNNFLTEELTGESLLTATMVKGKGLIRTKEFTPEELSEWSNRFYKKLMLHQILKPAYVLKRFIQSPKTLTRMVKQAMTVSK